MAKYCQQRIVTLVLVIMVYLALAGLDNRFFTEANQPPYFSQIGNTSRYYNMDDESFSEDLDKGHIVYRLFVEDPDDDCVHIDISCEEHFYIAEQNCTSADVAIQGKLDFETSPNITLTWILNDYMNDTVFEPITIYVIDANDPPTMEITPYTPRICENVPIGSSVFGISGYDEDSGEWGQLTFILSYNHEENPGLFTFNNDRWTPTYSEIMTSGYLDFERKSTHRLGFRVCDGGGLFVSDTVHIIVDDAPDTPPIFFDLPYGASLQENSVPGTSLFEVHAVDGDRGVNDNVTFSIKGSNSSSFGVDNVVSGRGIVYINEEIDRESLQNDILNVTILASEVTSTNYKCGLHSHGLEVTTTTNNATTLPLSTRSTASHTASSTTTSPLPKGSTEAQATVSSTTSPPSTGSTHPHTTADTTTSPPYTESTEAHTTVSTTTSSGSNDSSTWWWHSAPENLIEGMESNISVCVTVLDVNDEKPEFSSDRYVGYIRENAPINAVVDVTNITVTDLDQEENAVFELSIIGDEEAAFAFDVIPHFAQNEASVIIKVTDPILLDYERRQTFHIQIVAREMFTFEELNNTADVTVHLIDKNDNSPTFDAHRYETRVEEHSPIGTYVIRLNASDLDSGVYGEVTYSMVGDSYNLFDIDPSTGNVTVSDDYNLDRETTDRHRMTVAATDGGGRTGIVELDIYLDDINDNSPTFIDFDCEVFVRENEARVSVVKVKAMDDDIGSNGEIHYFITEVYPWVNAFEIDSMTGAISVISLDYDTLDPFNEGKYEVYVKAQDSGDNPLDNTTTVYVNVEGVNDNAPYFLQSEYYAYINDTFSGGDYVIIVRASDDDSPYGQYKYDSHVDYSIVSGGNDKFSLTPTTGEHIDSYSNVVIALDVDNMDVELYGDFYNITLRVSDRGNPRLESYCTVIVQVESTMVKTPEFRTKEVFETISEDMSPGHNITKIDTMVPGDFSFEIVDVQAFNERDENVTGTRDFTFQFSIDELTGVVRLNELLDREKVEFFIVEISVTSRSNNDSGYDQAMLRVKVQDVNDNAPVFSGTTLCGFEECYNAVVLEEYTVFQTYPGLKASDPDKGTNGDVEYNILNDTSNVQIDRYTGDITFTSNFDREEHDQINITVRAMDKGLPSFYEDILVIFKVHDINDNEPEFLNLPHSISIYENATVGDELYNVSAQDLDIGNNSVIEYSIIAGDTSRQFTIDRMGAVHLSKMLDREHADNYDLTIQAMDSPIDSPRLRNFGSLSISVLDINDNNPMFTDYEYNAEVREDESTGKVIAILTAEDADIGDNGFVEYSIGNRNDTEGGGELFSMRTEVYDVENTGEVYVSSATLLDRQGTYFLEIIATDYGIPPLSSTETLIVTVHDTNVNAPQFQYIVNADHVEQPLSSNFSQYVHVTEDYTGFICQVHAIDGDQGENARVTYLLNQSRDFFDIDRNSGEVTISHMTDREVIPSYLFSVIARDNGTPIQMSTELLITVLVDDINDNPPVFPRNEDGSPRSDTFHVSEAASSGTLVGIVTEASDADIGSNAENYYFLIGGDGHGQFTLNKYTRELTVKEQLDREVQHIYELVLKADDDENWIGPTATPIISVNDTTLNLLKIYIDDVNDNPPRFCQNGTSPTMESRRRRALDENQAMYHSDGLQNWKDVYFLSRVDEDGTENDPMLLIMDSKYDSIAAKHRIRVRSVSQEVIDVDPTPNVTIPENSDKGSKFPVKDHVVEDPDDLENGIFSLSVIDEGGQVLGVLPEEVRNIATITLVVKNSTYLDYEERRHFDIELLAQETRTDERFSDVYRLTIFLEDENDNCPIFNQTLYEGKVLEHANTGDFVLEVTASDLDSGEYGMITYGLTGEGAEKFDMDPQNGTMTVAEGAHFEWETKEVYDLVATATDGGNLTGYTNVNVYVIDTIITVDMNVLPSSSPIEGNTTVDVTFDTCVKNCKDFKNITVLNITLAEVPCSEWVDLSTNDSIQIQCITQRVESTSSSVVRVETETEVGLRFLLSSTHFYYKDPKINEFDPKIGPQSGGTTVTLQGSDLDAGNMIDVQIGHLPCEVDRDKISDQSIVCNNSRSETLFSSILRVTFDQAIRHSKDKFEYMEDPVVESVVPLRATVAGGSTQVVTGTNLHTIAQPKMSTTTVSKTVYNVLYSDCTVKNATHMTCPSPMIPEDAVTLQRRTRNIDQNCEDAIIVRDPNGNEIRFYIGFIMDGVTKWTNLSSTLPEYSQMNITKDPVYDVDTGIRTHNPEETEYLIIKGQGLNCGNTLNDILVFIGRDNCDTVSLSYEDLVCKPPRTQPPMLNTTNTYPEIIVNVSSRILFIGFLKYVSTSSETHWWIYGTIIASVSILLISIMVMVGVYRRRRRLDKERARKNRPVETFLVFEREEDSEAIRSNYLYPSVESGDNARRLLLESLDEEMRGEVESVLIDPKTSGMKMKLGKELGSGHFGKVYLSDLTDKSNCTTDVAVKVLQKYSPSQSDINDFLLEGTIMKDFQHQNVLNLIGVYIDVYGSPYIIIPYMANGDLRTHISRTDHHFKQALLIDFGLQVARGMDYLCRKKFVHRDLAARNCMVDGQMVVKVADFGLSRDIYEKEYYVSENKRALPVKWMAPECLSSQHFDTKSDVWSFGVLLWEVMTRGATPYAGIDNLDLMRHLKKGNRLPMPKYLSTKLYNVMRRCWCTSPEYRPTFSELVEDLEEVLLNDEHLDDPASDDIITKSYVQLIPHRQRDEDDDFSSDEEEFSSGDEWIKMKEMPLEEQAACLQVRQSSPPNNFDAAMECETLLLHDEHLQVNAKLSHAETGGVYTKLTTNDPGGFNYIGSEEDTHLNERINGYMVSGRGDKLKSSVGEDGYMANLSIEDSVSTQGSDRYILMETGNANMSMDPRDSYMLERAEDPHATDGSMVQYQKNGTVRKVIDDGYTKLAAGDTQVTKMGGYIPPGATGRYMETFPADGKVKPAGSRKNMGRRDHHQTKVGSDRHAPQESTDGYMDTFPRGDHLTPSDSHNYMALGREKMAKMEPHGHIIQGGTVGYMETFRAGANSTESARHDYMPLEGYEVTKMKPYEPNRQMQGETSDGYMKTSQVQGDWTTSASPVVQAHDDGYMVTLPPGRPSTSDSHNYMALGRQQTTKMEPNRHVSRGVTNGYMEMFPSDSNSRKSVKRDYMALRRNDERTSRMESDGFMLPGEVSTFEGSIEAESHADARSSHGYMPVKKESGRYMDTSSVGQDHADLGRYGDREIGDEKVQQVTPKNEECNQSHCSSVPSRGNYYVTLGEHERMKTLVKDEGMASGVTNRYTDSHGTGGRQAVVEDESYVESKGRGRYKKTDIEADDYELLKSRERETTETEADDYDLLKRTSETASYGGRRNNIYVCERTVPEETVTSTKADAFMSSGREDTSMV